MKSWFSRLSEVWHQALSLLFKCFGGSALLHCASAALWPKAFARASVVGTEAMTSGVVWQCFFGLLNLMAQVVRDHWWDHRNTERPPLMYGWLFHKFCVYFCIGCLTIKYCQWWLIPYAFVDLEGLAVLHASVSLELLLLHLHCCFILCRSLSCLLL